MSRCLRGNSVAIWQRPRQAGSGRLEFAIVAAILGIVITIFLGRVQFYQAEAELVSVKQVVTQLRTTLATKAAERYLSGNRQELAALAEENPMSWLARPPANYAGEFDGAAARAVPPGHWYFDRSTHTLGFLLSSSNIVEAEQQKSLNFRVKFRRNSAILTNSHADPAAGGLSLEQIDG